MPEGPHLAKMLGRALPEVLAEAVEAGRERISRLAWMAARAASRIGIRWAQALGILLPTSGVAGAWLLRDHVSSFVILGLCATTVPLGAGLFAAAVLQAPYLARLRAGMRGDAANERATDDGLDMESATTLTAYLAHEDELLAVGAMDALVRRGHVRLIPALILLRPEEPVLLRALSLFASSDRSDWLDGARSLLEHQREQTSMAAARALAAHGQLRAADLIKARRPRLYGYATLLLAMESDSQDLAKDASIAAILRRADPTGAEQRLGLLAALADVRPEPRLQRLLEGTATRVAMSSSTVELARAAAAQRSAVFIPKLIDQLGRRESREVIRTALTSFGASAIKALAGALRDPDVPRSVLIQIPGTLARFESRRAARILLDSIENARDGLVRYRALRALGRLVADFGANVDRARIEQLALNNLREHFRLLGLWAHLDGRPLWSAPVTTGSEPTERLLLGLLHDKLRQSLQRVFRLLKIAHPDEDLHRAHSAYLSSDERMRRYAVEFLEALLRGRDEKPLGRLLHFAAEEASLERVLERSRRLLPEQPPRSRLEALDRLRQDKDAMLSALAELYFAAEESGRISRGERTRLEHAFELAAERPPVGHA